MGGNVKMLSLTRRIGEEIVIGDDIVICVTGIRDGQVRLGIKAPASIPVHRREIANRILAESQQAQSIKLWAEGGNVA
jgi:carbon storage regulator